MGKFNWFSLVLLFIVFIIGFLFGCYWGVLKFVDHVGIAGEKMLSKVTGDINININATELAEVFVDKIEPVKYKNCETPYQCKIAPTTKGCRMSDCNYCCGTTCTTLSCGVAGLF